MIGPARFPRLATSLAFVLAFLAFVVAAQADTGSTRAARLTYLQGTVTVTQPDGGDSVPAQPNLPLLTGVQLATGNDGQAEVEFEDGSVVRLTPNSSLSLDHLAIGPNGAFITNLGLLRGLIYCELRATPQYRYSINAGGDILSPIENTTVRIDFDEPPAIFSVLDGTAQVERQGSDASSAGYQTQVRAGESLRADPADATRYFLSQQIAADSWDQWNDDRDQAAAAEAADSTAVRDNYAGAEGYGWSDLDANGNWYNVPGQGAIWQPQIAADDSGFDPYGNGAWVWYSGAGYVWASGYSWGWTPYRCGNWSYYGGFGWGWSPGSGCGGVGWGFAGGGRPVNIVVGPTGYHPIRVPVPGPHPRPIWPIHTPSGMRTASTPTAAPGPRRIAGVMAQPVQRQGRAPDLGAPAGSSLRRDYPIDASSRTPVLGLASTSPVAVHTAAGLHPSSQASRPAASQPAESPDQGTFYGGRRYPSNGQPAPVGAVSPQRQETATPGQPSAGENSPYRRPAEESAPVSRPAQPSAPAPSYERNSPQPAERPAERQTERSSPPPERPAERPAERSSPPPERSAPPAPAPASHSESAPEPSHNSNSPK